MNFKLEENHFLIFLLYMYIRTTNFVIFFNGVSFYFNGCLGVYMVTFPQKKRKRGREGKKKKREGEGKNKGKKHEREGISGKLKESE